MLPLRECEEFCLCQAMHAPNYNRACWPRNFQKCYINCVDASHPWQSVFGKDREVRFACSMMASSRHLERRLNCL